MKVLGIAGSLRQKSFNKMLLHAAAELAPKDMEIEVFDLGEIPLFNQDLEAELPEAVKMFKDKIKAADAILFATPEYNYSIPGVLKNAIDWGSRPYGDNSWQGKTVAVMGATIGSTGTIRAQFALRQTFVFLDMHQVNKPEIYVNFADKKFAEDGTLTDVDTAKYVGLLLQALYDWTKQIKQ